MENSVKKIVLASASPRRKELLETLGISFKVLVSNIEEKPIDGEVPGQYAARNAREKALAVVAQFPDQCQNSVVIGCDTIVVSVDGRILEKPSDKSHAISMLRELSGSRHTVISGLAFVCGDSQKILYETPVITEVAFREMSDPEITAYVATGEPMDKAGSYGAQGRAAVFIEGIFGSYTNVVGLPLCETAEALKAFGGIELFSAQKP